jgi:hypothetical protein
MAMNVVEQAFKQRVETKYPERRVTIGRVAVLTEPLGDRGACHYCGPCCARLFGWRVLQQSELDTACSHEDWKPYAATRFAG